MQQSFCILPNAISDDNTQIHSFFPFTTHLRIDQRIVKVGHVRDPPPGFIMSSGILGHPQLNTHGIGSLIPVSRGQLSVEIGDLNIEMNMYMYSEIEQVNAHHIKR